MGHEIEKIALQRNHDIHLIINTDADWKDNEDRLKTCDAAIEFSLPETATANYKRCFAAGVPVISGTTGWLDQRPLIEKICLEQQQAFFYASNFSIGVNLFFELNRKLAQLMTHTDGYEILMEEIHHIHKLDAPSGTAISLAEDIIDTTPGKDQWINQADAAPHELPIVSKRIGEVPGTHCIQYESAADLITIRHEAKNRSGFALGAVIAAEWIQGKTGIFGMADLIK